MIKPFWIGSYFIGLLLGKQFLVDPMVGTKQGDFPGPAMASGAGPFWFGLPYTIGILGLILLIWLFSRPTKRLTPTTDLGHKPFSGLKLALIMFGLAWTSQWLFLILSATPLVNHSGEDVLVRGTIVEDPRVGPDWASYQLDVREFFHLGQGWRIAKGTVIIQVNKPGDTWAYGDTVEFAGKLDWPKTANNPGQFDYRRYLARRGIYLMLTAHPGQKGERLAQGSGNPLKKASLAVRKQLAKTGTTLFPGQEGQLLNGMVLGAANELDPELRETFNTTGLSHLLSVSGFHVALIAVFPVLLGKSRGWSPRITFSLAVATVLGYSLVSGLSPPVVRSAVMITLGLFALLFKFRKHWPTILAVAALLTTFPYPQVIIEPGYQLSFTATWAILALTPFLEERLACLPKPVPDWIKSLLAVPIAAQLGTWPLVAYHFNQVSLISCLANLLLVDVAGLILILGLIVAVTGVFSLGVAEIFQLGLGLLLKLFLQSVDYLARLPGAAFNITSPAVALIIVYFGLLWLISDGNRRAGIHKLWRILLFQRPELREVFKRWLPGLVGLVVIAVLFWLWPGTSALQVTFLDVGEGACIFVRTPEGHTMLVDTGRLQLDEEGRISYDSGKKVVLPYLRSQGLNSLDLLVLTHPHSDHVGGAEAILQQLKVGKMLISPAQEESVTYSQVLNTAKIKGIPLEQGWAGQEIRLDPKIKLVILGPIINTEPSEVTGGAETQLNNQSLVIKLTYGSHSFLLTGDVEQAGITQLLAQTDQIKSTVLNIPHHGSRTGYLPEFYRQVQPLVAVIPVGPNFFGHPHPEVVKYFRQAAIPLLRTDQWGAITFQSDGRQLKVDSFAQGTTGLKQQL
ncbi:MAG: DNA internalization-related competence protein ComEC/Rec2 [Carboxydocellales bacterium]